MFLGRRPDTRAESITRYSPPISLSGGLLRVASRQVEFPVVGGTRTDVEGQMGWGGLRAEEGAEG